MYFLSRFGELCASLVPCSNNLFLGLRHRQHHAFFPSSCFFALCSCGSRAHTFSGSAWSGRVVCHHLRCFALYLYQRPPATTAISTHLVRHLRSSAVDSRFCGRHPSLARFEWTANCCGFRPRLSLLLSVGLCGTPTFVGRFFARCARMRSLSATLWPQQWRSGECHKIWWSTQRATFQIFCRLFRKFWCTCGAKLAKTFGHFSQNTYLCTTLRLNGGMVDTRDLKSLGHYGCTSSSLVSGTSLLLSCSAGGSFFAVPIPPYMYMGWYCPKDGKNNEKLTYCFVDMWKLIFQHCKMIIYSFLVRVRTCARLPTAMLFFCCHKCHTPRKKGQKEPEIQ